MFCTNCGNEVEQHAKFCSKCGTQTSVASVSSAPPPQRKAHDMNMHVNVLGWLMVGSGILTGLLALPIMFAGQIVQHMNIPQPPDFPFPIPIGHFAGSIATIVGLSIGALAAGTAAAGVGLLHFRSWARGLTIVMAVLLVFHFPVGTAVAIYAFWVLFSREGQEYYKTRSAGTMA